MIYKKDIATEYLNAAMQMYLRKENYFCAIHLAAAAFELFDLHLPKNQQTYELMRRAQRQLHKLETGNNQSDKDISKVINGSKNAIKHMNDGEQQVDIDPVYEARWYIDHALNCYERLGLEKTRTVWAYQDRRSQEIGSL